MSLFLCYSDHSLIHVGDSAISVIRPLTVHVFVQFPLLYSADDKDNRQKQNTADSYTGVVD
jgi:hypothetical protein